jgi:monofunctional glycosyltransferase
MRSPDRPNRPTSRAPGKGRSPARRGFRWRLLRALLLLALIPVAASVLITASLRFIDPPTSAFMLARQFSADAAAPARVDYRWQPWEQLSPALLVALVAAEDQHFPVHRGFDMAAIESVLSARGDGRMRGASTISQQVAKNLFLWSGRSWIRKALEAWFTVLIETFWSKQRILEVYANIAEFGDGIYGAEAAAQRHFGIPARQLDPSRAARLAAVLPNPRRYSASAPGPYVLNRQAWIAQQARQLGGPDYLAACCGPLP